MHFDHPVFILLIAAAALLRWLAQRAARSEEGRGEDTRTTEDSGRSVLESRRVAQTDEERVRRFMEALGQPTTSKPPPKVAPRPFPKQVVLPRRPIGPVLPTLTTRPPDPPPGVGAPAPPARLLQPRPARIQQRTQTPSSFEVRDVDGTRTEQESAGSGMVIPAGSEGLSAPTRGIVARLATASALRDAIVLREIFGPPRGLEMADRF
ncbi:MAG: hypothetical protein M3Z64_07005 [Verrucomicrobiota bacterium]|nr:hypothetical protein [Verrucomicrobiota bacterium]